MTPKLISSKKHMFITSPAMGQGTKPSLAGSFACFPMSPKTAAPALPALVTSSDAQLWLPAGFIAGLHAANLLTSLDAGWRLPSCSYHPTFLHSRLLYQNTMKATREKFQTSGTSLGHGTNNHCSCRTSSFRCKSLQLPSPQEKVITLGSEFQVVRTTRDHFRNPPTTFTLLEFKWIEQAKKTPL